ncbi:hypothetical protein Sjap_016320 [Stephania japonica]|uniref:Uncharacterized protein n=1 Tax=Stephania japonica TaxID=461633 RepID=A0AAP0IKV2_9MAGN
MMAEQLAGGCLSPSLSHVHSISLPSQFSLPLSPRVLSSPCSLMPPPLSPEMVVGHFSPWSNNLVDRSTDQLTRLSTRGKPMLLLVGAVEGMGPSAPPASGVDYAGGPPAAGQRATAPLSGRCRGGGRVANHPFPPLSLVYMGWGKSSLLVGLPPPSPARMGLPCGPPPPTAAAATAAAVAVRPPPLP